MTETSAQPNTAPLYRLRTFGTLSLVGARDATVLGTHGHHRRRLALLAALAAAGDQGLSRDRLLLLFWPDAAQPRARHSLDQLLYALRNSIGESVFASAAPNPVCLNPDVLTSDVGVFNAALERDDFEAAIEAYRGPFLDGFYLDDAPEFGNWVDAERARLAGSYAGALEKMARKAEAARENTNAVRWWRQLAATDPLSSTNAANLIRALMNAGDHPAALQYADNYEAVVAQELGTSVGPAVAKLAAEIRAASKSESIVASKPPVLVSHFPPPVDGLPASVVPAVEPLRQLPARLRAMQFAIGALVISVVVVALAAWMRATGDDTTLPATGEPSSIAVLPFSNVSGDPQDAMIMDGLSEDLMMALSKIGKLRVIARQSAFAFRNSDADARVIGDSLGVANLLESSFQRSGSRLRLRMRLVDTRDGSTRWSETYDRDFKDLFAVQSEIAAVVASELDLRLRAGVARKLRRGVTQNYAAYELYLRGRDPVHLRSDSGPRVGLALLHQAVALDSSFAAAYANMPRLYFLLSGQARDVPSAEEFKRLALAAARKALELDPQLAEAHMGMGGALYGLHDLSGAEAAHRRAIERGGAPRVHEALTRVLMSSGRHGEALAEALRAVDVDPLSPTAAANLGEALCMNGRYEEGLAQLKRVDNVGLLRLRGFRGLCYVMQERWPEAISEFGDARVGDQWSPLLGYALVRSGDIAKSSELKSKAIEHWRQTGRGAIKIAVIAAARGDHDEAFEWLERGADDLQGFSVIMYPLFQALQTDPRFERYRQRLGLQKR